MTAPDQIKPVIRPDHQWHGVLTNDYGAEIEVFGDLGVDPDEDGTRWAYPPVQYTRTNLVDPATIREDALREAADACQRIAGNTKDFHADHRRAAGQCAAMILALIGEQK